MQGWLCKPGRLWTPGDEIFVRSPMALLNQKLAIQNATFTQDSTNGTETTLDMVLPGLLKGSPNLDPRGGDMHRATPLHTSICAYTAGGSRCVRQGRRHQADAGGVLSIMHNEARIEIEAAQNYGFTSVHFDSEQDQNGKTVGADPSSVSWAAIGRSPQWVQLMIAGTGSTSWRPATRDVPRPRRQAAVPHDQGRRVLDCAAG